MLPDTFEKIARELVDFNKRLSHLERLEGGGGVANHNILDGNVHLDSTLDAVTAGSIIFGNNTPDWDELVAAANGQVLTLAAGLPSWADSAGLVLIQDVLLGAPAASIDFQNIPQTYTHLFVKGVMRTDKVGTLTTSLRVRFNNDVGANYETQFLRAFNITVNAVGAGGVNQGNAGITIGALGLANQASLVDFFLPNYTETTFEKISIAYSLAFYAANYGQYKFDGTHWQNAAAITRLTFFGTVPSNFIAGTHLTLYGLY